MPDSLRYRASGCGEKGIRTLGTRKGTTVFETAPIDHSGISPNGLGCKCIHFIGKKCGQIHITTNVYSHFN